MVDFQGDDQISPTRTQSTFGSPAVLILEPRAGQKTTAKKLYRDLSGGNGGCLSCHYGGWSWSLPSSSRKQVSQPSNRILIKQNKSLKNESHHSKSILRDSNKLVPNVHLLLSSGYTRHKEP
ncbi:GL13889 [Drosophila persimilis]|uniref:GL13889 n=1 Tax=Drosophila persimilis TaxID=7234 RepID=B4GQS9_DROPE|nr:GL13889 [Drosophila persimilis]